MIDGPQGSICTVDWDRSMYRPYDGLAPGEKYMNPEDTCDKFDRVALIDVGPDEARVLGE